VTNSIGKGQGDGHLITKIHERMLEKIKQTYEKDTIPEWLKTVKVEKNPVIEGQAKALYMAYKAFVKRYKKPDAVILYLSVPKRKSYCHFEQTLWQQFKLEDIAWAEGERPQVEFLQFDQMSTKLSLNEKDRHLYYREKMGGKKKVVAIAYFQVNFILFIYGQISRPLKFPHYNFHICEYLVIASIVRILSIYLNSISLFGEC
jgi:hypothetical protein